MNSNLHEKATFYLVNDLWAYDRIEASNVTWRFQQHVEFPNAARIEYTVRGKRKRKNAIITTSPFVMLDGWGHPTPPPKFGDPKGNPGQGYTTQTTRYPSCSSEWHIEFDAFLNNYLEKSKARIVLDLRKHDPTKSGSSMENHNLFKIVEDIPPGAAARHWILRADYRCAGGSHWHAKVNLSESPLYLELGWHQTADDPVQHVGVFCLDLTRLLRDGYIRPESKDSQNSDVRLRIFRADEGSFYVQTNQRGRGLLLANVLVPDLGSTSYLDPDIHSDASTKDTIAATEGRRRLVVHLQRERNQTLVRNKKKQATSLDCEICKFSFGRYGSAASDYCEVHHLLPLSEVDDTTLTRIEDLAILCANCHRVVHLHNPPYTLNEVRSMLAL
jgi:hypothetical protein